MCTFQCSKTPNKCRFCLNFSSQYCLLTVINNWRLIQGEICTFRSISIISSPIKKVSKSRCRDVSRRLRIADLDYSIFNLDFLHIIMNSQNQDITNVSENVHSWNTCWGCHNILDNMIPKIGLICSITCHTLKKKQEFWFPLTSRLLLNVSEHLLTNKMKKNRSKMSLMFYFSIGTLIIV